MRSSEVLGIGRPPKQPNPPVNKVLGQAVDYKFQYDPSLLVPVARLEERKHLFKGEQPFTGVDVWNAYEVGCLNKNGLPVCGFAKIIYNPITVQCIPLPNIS